MRQNLLLTFTCALILSQVTSAQFFKIQGKITNSKLEPLGYVSIQVKEITTGAISNEKGEYELLVEEGKYDVVFSMVGFKTQLITIVVHKGNYSQNIIMEYDEAQNLSEVVVRGKVRDRSEEFIRNVIRNKDVIFSARGAFSGEAYIKAVQEDSFAVKKKKRKVPDSLAKINPNADLDRMTMVEVKLKFDQQHSHLKEERTAVKKRGNTESLFYMSLSDGEFDLYNNLVKVPGVSSMPLVSPVSFSGLSAYKFRLLKTDIQNGSKFYTIRFKAKQTSNATLSGEIVIQDSLWVIISAVYELPPFHMAEYDFFQVEQQYEFENNSAWIISRQKFTYLSKTNKSKKSGNTVALFKNFEFNKQFERGHFGTEVSSTSIEAYEKDTTFWKSTREEPLTVKEIRFIHYKDSIYRATRTKSYLDSIDNKTNKITVGNVLFAGQSFNDHEKERRWYIPPLPTFYQPFQLGGARIYLSFFYNKTSKSRKNISLFNNLSYGIRNNDLNGSVRLFRLYNPFNRGFYSLFARRNFEYIFQGDAWINMLKRSNVFLNSALGLEHGLELSNGLFLTASVDFSYRKSVEDYKFNHRYDSLLADILTNNLPVSFPSYHALYGQVRLQYTPKQRFIREPNEKIILGSSWPTFYTSLRQGIPDLLNSKVDFQYLEFGMEQRVKAGLAGVASYSIKSGSFIRKKDLRLVDYNFQRQGDPILFNNPHQAFQSLDSSFPVFKRFYQGHYVHELNGGLLNRIPLFKKLQLREIAGGGFLIAPERNLRYGELFAGVERAFKMPFVQDNTKIKLGVYVVASEANQFNNPVQVKVGITTWDKSRNRWF